MKPIPITAAKRIAKDYGYDQVIIIARKVGDDPQPHGEHCTTYGVDKAHCGVAARIGDFLKHKVMGWEPPADQQRLETDAARYQWLREQDWDTGSLAVVAQPKEAIKLGHDAPSRERLDEMIDAARQGGGV